MKHIYLILIFCLISCGPDLNPDKYWIKSIVLNTYEEYYFQYAGDKLIGVEGTDSISLSYTHYKDSVAIKYSNKAGKLYQTAQLSYLSGELSKVKISWRFNQIWYKDSIQFIYSGNNLSSFVYKKNNFQVTIQSENITGIKKGLLGIGGNYTASYDQLTNPLNKVYWLDSFLLINGFTTTLQPKSILRYFSKNNISTFSSSILGATESEKYSYIYLHGILPKSISVDVVSGKVNYENVVFIFDIQYANRSNSGY